MKKKWLILNCITFMLFCQPIIGVSAFSEAQKTAISGNCVSIKESLKTTQRVDTRARVYLGGKFEAVLTRFITPLNVKLVENNVSNLKLFENNVSSLKLLENQSEFATAKASFSNDFVKYQQALEELVNMDCKAEPEAFYEKLLLTRERRELVKEDTIKLKELLRVNVDLVTELRRGL